MMLFHMILYYTIVTLCYSILIILHLMMSYGLLRESLVRL